MTETMSTDLQGLDLDAFHRWYDAERPGDLGADLRGRFLAGGKSNLTYEITDGSTVRVVRRPPLGHVQATAHDMGREYTAMSALAGTAVPVPTMYAMCREVEVIGAEFYVMEKVEGTPFRSAEQLEEIGPEATGRLGDAMVDVLAALHQVDPAEVGLSELGRPEGFLERQVRRWGRQLDGSRTRELPDADTLLARLSASIPEGDAEAVRAGIVHGDYRLDNLLSDPDRRGEEVLAVVDWEMATLGDPLTDVALLQVYDRLSSITGGAAVADASRAPGYPSSEHQLERYVAAGGLSLDTLDFHLGLAYFKLAAILEGITYRHQQGQTVGDGFEGVGDSVEPLLAAGLDATRSLA